MTTRSVGATLYNLSRGNLIDAGLSIIDGGLDPLLQSFWDYARPFQAHKGHGIRIEAMRRPEALFRFDPHNQLPDLATIDQGEVEEIKLSRRSAKPSSSPVTAYGSLSAKILFSLRLLLRLQGPISTRR